MLRSDHAQSWDATCKPFCWAPVWCLYLPIERLLSAYLVPVWSMLGVWRRPLSDCQMSVAARWVPDDCLWVFFGRPCYSTEIHQLTIKYQLEVYCMPIICTSCTQQLSFRCPSVEYQVNHKLFHQMPFRYPTSVHELSIRCPTEAHRMSIRSPKTAFTCQWSCHCTLLRRDIAAFMASTRNSLCVQQQRYSKGIIHVCFIYRGKRTPKLQPGTLGLPLDPN